MEYDSKAKYIKLFIIIFSFLIIFLAISSDARKRFKHNDDIEALETLLKNQSETKTDVIQPQSQPQSQSQFQDEIIIHETSTENTDTCQQALEAGNKIKSENNIMGAIEKFKSASECPDEEIKETALNSLILCYRQLNEVSLIIETYETLLGMQKDEKSKKEIYNNLGQVYFDNGDFGSAVQMYKLSYQINPDYESSLKLCELYDMVQDIESLKIHLNEYISKNPEKRPDFEKYLNIIKPQTPPPAQEEQPPSPEEPAE